MSATAEVKTEPTFREIMDKAAASAMRGGTAGAVAMGLNVGALMWMRTTVRVLCNVYLMTAMGCASFHLRTSNRTPLLVHILCLITYTVIFTQVNYQYRNGTSFPVALRTLYADGGIPRFYRGVLPALIQGPMSRFGDTAANTGMLTLMNSMDATKDLNVGWKTATASAAAAAFRIFLMPVVRVRWVVFISFGGYWWFVQRSNVAVWGYQRS